MPCSDTIPLSPMQSTLLAIGGCVLLVTLFVAIYFDLRKQERERPRENWRGPFPVRYIKHLLMAVANGATYGF